MDVAVNKSVMVLQQGDITRPLKVDAIVNAANSRLAGGGGVDGAIHLAGGPAIMEECRKIGGCPTGSAVITTAGALPAQKVIHTVGPVYRGGRRGEQDLLKNAYHNSLTVAEKAGMTSVAFPSISTGVYGYPIGEAGEIALSTVIGYLQAETIIEKVVFVLFSARDLDVYKACLGRLG